MPVQVFSDCFQVEMKTVQLPGRLPYWHQIPDMAVKLHRPGSMLLIIRLKPGARINNSGPNLNRWFENQNG